MPCSKSLPKFTMKAIIVEDSRLARLELRQLLQTIPELEIVGEAEHPDDAQLVLAEHKPDLMFLDIHMPGKNGFELLDELEDPPLVIFTTAYHEHALRSFDYDAVDYLLKPIEPERLGQAIQKAQRRLQQPEQTQPIRLDATSSVFIKDGDKCWMLELSRIHRIESCGNYSQIFFDGNRPLIHKSLNQLEEKLPEELFFRASRQTIINIKSIHSVEPWVSGNLKLFMQDGAEVEVSRRHSTRFRSLLSL